MYKPLFVSTNLTGKMKGITGVTTYFKECKFCSKMQSSTEEDCICKYCYATTIENRNYRDAIMHYKDNTKILNSHIYRSDIPNFKFNNAGTNLVRYNSHGEMDSLECFINFCNIARANPIFRFALWTKRQDILIQAAKEGIIVPKNICIVLSSLKVNKPITPQEIEILESKGVFIDTVFTVYTPNYLEEHKDIKINCGDRQCAQCLKCYTHHTKVKYINELIKNVNKKELCI